MSALGSFDSIVTPENNPLLREDFVAPTVAFSSKLGEIVDYIDFDYDTFDTMARQEGLNGRDISKYTIHYGLGSDIPARGIVPKRKRTDALGQYFPGRKLSYIAVDNFRRSSYLDFFEEHGIAVHGYNDDETRSNALSSATVHETGHYADRRQTIRSLGRSVASFLLGFAETPQYELPRERYALRVQRDHLDKRVASVVLKRERQ